MCLILCGLSLSNSSWISLTWFIKGGEKWKSLYLPTDFFVERMHLILSKYNHYWFKLLENENRLLIQATPQQLLASSLRWWLQHRFPFHPLIPTVRGIYHKGGDCGKVGSHIRKLSVPCCQRIQLLDFPDGPEVKNPPADAGFDPWSWKSPHAVGQQSPRTTTTEPVVSCNFWSPHTLEPRLRNTRSQGAKKPVCCDSAHHTEKPVCSTKGPAWPKRK